MASITKRTKKDGPVVYDAAIKVRKHGDIVHREKKSFTKLKLARDWALRRELELQEHAVYKEREKIAVGTVIELYIKEFPPSGKTKSRDMRMLIKQEICKKNVHTLTARDLILHIKFRNTECLPQTANNDLIWLNTAIKTMSGLIDLDVDMSIFEKAREILRKEGLIAKSTQRDRRPTRKELWILSRYFVEHATRVPMLHIMWFAIYSARRQNEIMQILWADINHDDRTCMIRDLKHPTKKGINKRFKIPRRAYKIIMRQPENGPRVFPYNSKTCGTYFHNACKMLDIRGLTFHDLRHEATSRLFEQDLSIVQVQQVTLHSNWDTLKRYANLNPGDLDI